MLSKKLKLLTEIYGVKIGAIAETMGIARMVLWYKLKDDSFTAIERFKIYEKYGPLLNLIKDDNSESNK